MKKSLFIACAIVLVIAIAAMVGCSLVALADDAPAASGEKSHKDYKIAHISDIHVMIEEYCNIYSLDYQAAGNTSYKVLEQTEAAVEAVFNEMCMQCDASGRPLRDANGDPVYKDAADIPMYVVITGDLTSNGELADHIGVARLLEAATKKIRAIPGMNGFQIFVIPGNHDIDNQHAKAYSPAPDDAEWKALLERVRQLQEDESATAAEVAAHAAVMRDYLAGLEGRSVETTTMLQFMTIYSDYGYCNCPDRKNGHHLDECNMAEGIALEFFYESDYWYETGITRSDRPMPIAGDVLATNYNTAEPYGDYIYNAEYMVYDADNNPSAALSEERYVPDEVVEAFKRDKDMEYYASYSRHGACSYIARVNGLTVLGIDANSHKYTGYDDDDNIATISSRGWHETTGGYMTKAQINWMLDNLAQHEDVAKDNLIIALAHENVLPHFDTEDEVISLFCYDNWEDVYTNLADNGVRYVYTGHQHTNDIESAASQAGSVFYDVETGSTTCMGAGWRELDYRQTFYTDGAYSEDLWSTMHFLHYNEIYTDLAGQDHNVFGYLRYEVDDNANYNKVYTIQGDVASGDYSDLAEFMAQNLKGMIRNMAGNIVNDNLMTTLHGFTAGLANVSEDLYGLVNKVLDDLDGTKVTAQGVDRTKGLNLYEFIVKEDGTFELGDIKKGYHLTQFAEDLVDYFLDHDYSFGRSATPVKLDDVLLYVYGNHLIGGQQHSEKEIPANIQALLDVLEDGTFLRYFEDLMLRGVMPQLQRILYAPIYWGEDANYTSLDGKKITAADVADGEGFDLHEYASVLQGEVQSDSAMVASVIKLLKGFIADMDFSSLVNLVRSIPGVIDDLRGVLDLFGVFDLASEKLGRDISPYIDLAIDYIKQLDEATIIQMVQAELLDKYVTDAFCKNLGSYAAYIVRSVVVDDSVDGTERTDSDSLFPYEVTPRFLVQLTANDITALNGHSYYRDKDGKDKVKVVATTQNGLLPGKITLGNVMDANGNLDVTQKQIRWFTQRDVDYTNVCKPFEVDTEVYDLDEDEIAALQSAAKHFQCEIQYGTARDFAGVQPTVVTGVNEWIEYPTVDLGIAYFNLTYAYRQYNDYTVVLKDLAPDTTYYYRIRSIDGQTKYDWTPTYSFTTGSTANGFSVMAITDIQGSIEQNYIASLFNLMEALSKGSPDFILNCGDNVDKGENIAQWEWLLDDQAAVWANNTYAGVVGNHEDHNFSLSYVTATPATATVDESGFYYAFTYQNVHFVMLNSNDIGDYSYKDDAGKTQKGQGLAQGQYDWLVADLAAAQADSKVDFVVVVLHKGPYTAGSHAFDSDVVALRAQLTPVFARYGVDLVLQGHDHTYSVSQYITGTKDQQGNFVAQQPTVDASGAVVDPEGVLYVNLGTMGDKYYNYIYSPQVALRDRSGDAYQQTVFARYFTEKGNLELSPVRDSKTVYPETPVYAYLSVRGQKLSLDTYTVIEGTSYLVDSILITKVADNTLAADLKLGSDTYSVAQLADITPVRLPLTTADGSAYYMAYSLADLYAIKGKTNNTLQLNGQTYAVKDVLVAYAMAADAFAAGESMAPLYIVAGQVGQPTVLVADNGALPTWATVIIVLAAVLVACGLVAFVLLRKKNNPPKAPAEADAAAASTEGEGDAEGEAASAEDAPADADEDKPEEDTDEGDDNIDAPADNND